MCSGSHALKLPSPNLSSPPSAICDGVDAAVDGCIGRLRLMRLSHNIKSVGFATFVMNVVGVDERGEAVGGVMSYGGGGEGTKRETEICRDIVGGREEEYHQTTGAFIHNSYLPGQVRDFARRDPAGWRRVKRLQTVAGCVVGRWLRTAECPMSYSEASWTGLFDVRSKGWAWEYVDMLMPLGGGDKLPPV
ncbi:hypothetical protein TrRE_jg12342, partial [Triparma retinervis]